MKNLQLNALTAVCASLLLGCSSAEDSVTNVTPAIPGGPLKPSSVQDARSQSPIMAIVDYTKVGLPAPAVVERFAQADIVVLDMANFWSDDVTTDVVQALKDENPGIRVIGYVNAHDCWLNLEGTSNSYYADWYAATKPFWSYTTTGDTMQSWPGKVLVNVLDPACRKAMIDVLAAHIDAHPSRIDGFFWDHFNEQLWVPDELPGVDGEMDLDGDGIAHQDDLDEQAAYRDASVAMVQETRSRLGDELLQITNGMRAARDSTFAALFDGMYYENFPEVGFWGPGYSLAVDPDVAHNLFAAREWLRKDNGGPWVILSNKYEFSFLDHNRVMTNYREAEFVRVMALLTDTAVSYHSDQRTIAGWPDVAIDLGAPLGGVRIDGTTYERDFEKGHVTMTLTTSRRPVPFEFAIVQDGDTVQSFALPRHFP